MNAIRDAQQEFALRTALLTPRAIADFTLADWDKLVRQARATGLLARVALLLEEAGVDACVPDVVRWHLDSARSVYHTHCDDIRREVGHIVTALKVAGLRPVLLKGAAYWAAGDRAMLGRVYGDVDLFVPREQLSAVEDVLRWQGWVGKPISDYDDAYYRRWMHELPPLVHRKRGLTLDVHHNLLPLTSRIRLDATLLAAAVTPSRIDGVDTLAPVDRVLHSAAHLLLGGEFENAFRDLSDLHLLLAQMSAADPGFWDSLAARAEELGLARVLHYTLQTLERLLDHEAPSQTLERLRPHAPPRWLASPMEWLFATAFQPTTLSEHRFPSETAQFALFIRSHYLKMPLPLLVRHLAHKAFITPPDEREKP